MNARSYKTVFSKRLGALVAVGEHATSQGKANGASGPGASGANDGAVSALAGIGYVAALSASFAFVSLAWAAPATNALPTGGTVVQGAASMSQTANQLNIQQATQRAAINWQSFNIGAAATVKVAQPNAQAVLLNRVVGQSPSQIFGKLQANGHVILVNPNGVLFGKDGSVNAGGFTASTLNISDANFMAGNMVYERNGSTAGIVNQGSITAAPGGYVALLGATVSNEGSITTKGGSVVMGAGETIKVPVSGTGRIKLELTPAAINASLSNTGSIVTEGGQVYMQALALNRAAAQILQSGSIDTSGEKGGDVHVLADGGHIRVDGRIKANSNNGTAGGDIYIGRDKDTNVLAAVGDVRGATLESQGGFIETSGWYLATNGVNIKAKDWLLDPADITISTGNDADFTNNSGIYEPNSGSNTSVVKVDTIQTAINAGTSVTITTTNTGTSGSGAGNITIANALAFANDSNTDATLNLIADNGITQNTGASIITNAVSGKTGRVNISMTAKGNYQGNTAASAGSQGVELRSTINTNGTVTISGTNKNTGAGAGVQFSNGASITTTTGSAITVNGTATAGTAYGVSLFNTLLDAGTKGDVSITGTSFGNHGIYNSWTSSNAYNMKLVGHNVTLNGTSSGVNSSGFYSFIGSSAGNIITASGDIAVTGTANGSGTGSALFFATTNWQTFVNSYTAGGTITFKGTNTTSANTATAIRLFGMQAKTTGSGAITVEASTQNAGTNAITVHSATALSLGYQGGATSLVSTAGDVKILANQGGISFNDGVPNNVSPTTVSGRNISIDNTGGTIDADTGAITRGKGQASGSVSGIRINDARELTATGNINLNGAGTSASGVEISGAAKFSATNIHIDGENTVASGAAINMSNAASSLTASSGVTLTSGGTGSGTSLVAAGNISVGTQLKITTPAVGSIAGVISGTGSLLKMGAGQTRLTAVNGTTFGTNTFSGGTTISQGSLLFGNGNGNYNKTAGTGAITLGDANTGSSDVGLWIEKGTSSGQASLARNITVSNHGTGTATIGAAGTGTGGWSIITGPINLQRNVTFSDTTNDRLGLDGQITGTGNITIAGTGSGLGPRVSMGSAKTFTGNVTINAGVQLLANASNLFNSSTNIQANGTFNLNSTSQAINSLNGNSTGRVTNVGTLTIGSNNGDGAFAGVIANNSKLVKKGTGTQILSGNNTYTGGTQVAAGTLQIGNGTTNGLIGPGAVDIAEGATLNFNVNTTAVNYGTSNTFTGVGTFRKTGNAGLTWGTGIATFSLGAGSLIDVQQGILTGGANGNDVWTNNKASLNVAGGAIFAGVESNIRVDALSGAGTVSSGYGSPGAYNYGFTVGVNNGNGTFSGVIQNGNANANLTKVGTGTQILTGSNTYSGTTTISEGVLQVGNGGTTGNLGAGAVIDNASLVFNRSNSLTVANAISGSGSLTQAGSGTTILTGNNSYAGTNVSNGTLQVGNGGTTGTLGAGAVALSNNANLAFVRSVDTSITNVITGTGNISANITSNAGTAGALTVNSSNISVDGTIDLRADGDVTLNTPIVTSSVANGTGSTKTAVTLVAGQALNAGNSSGGNVKITGAGNITVGTGGVAAIYSGSIDGTTGTSVMVPSGSGKFRYNSDETTTNYTKSLDQKSGTNNGVNVIYREAPTVEVTAYSVASGNLTYNGLTQTGTTGYTHNATNPGVLKNGDASAGLTGTALYAYNNSGVTDPKNAGTYTVTASNLSSDVGYALSYKTGSLVIDQKEVKLEAAKTYDGGKTLTGTQLTITTGVGTETLGFNSATINSKDVKDNSTNFVKTVDLADGTNGGKASNYKFTAAQSDNNKVTLSKANLTVTLADQTKTYDGTTAATLAPAAFTVKGVTVAGQTETASVNQTVAFYNDKNVLGASSVTANLAAGNFAAATGTDLNNYNLPTSVTGKGTITPRPLTIAPGSVATKTADGTTAAVVTPGALSYLVGNETLGVAATGMFSDANAGTNKAVNAFYTLQNGANGGLASNYILALGKPGNPDTRMTGTILAAVNPVTPIAQVNNNTGSVSRVRTVSGFGGAGAATGVLDDKAVTESREVCSDVFPENCECQPSVIPSIEICFAPKSVAATKEEK